MRGTPPVRIAAVAAVAAAVLGGCGARVQVPGQQSGTYLGVVRVTSRELPSDIQISQVDMLGAAVGGGLRLGWNSTFEVTASPEACRIIVLIRNTAELDHAQAVLANLERNDLCAAKF